MAEADQRSRAGGTLRPHDLRHHAITKLAESSESSEQTIMAIAGHVSREMLEHYSHISVKKPSARRWRCFGSRHSYVTIGKMEGCGSEAGELEKPHKYWEMDGRTAHFEVPHPSHPKRMLYQAEPRPDSEGNR